jgi:hypothetical protein
MGTNVLTVEPPNSPIGYGAAVIGAPVNTSRTAREIFDWLSALRKDLIE